jgi:hypothetical protein
LGTPLLLTEANTILDMSLAHIEMQRKDDYIDDLGSSGRPNVDSLLRREEEEEGTEPSPKRMRTAAEGKHSETDERSLFGLNTLGKMVTSLFVL